MASGFGSIEFARAHDRTELNGKLFGQSPGVTAGCRNPEVEGAARHRDIEAIGLQGLRQRAKTMPVTCTLVGHVGVIGPRESTRGLHRSTWHQTRVFAQLRQVIDEFAITSVEADTGPCEVRTLRK